VSVGLQAWDVALATCLIGVGADLCAPSLRIDGLKAHTEKMVSDQELQHAPHRWAEGDNRLLIPPSSL